MLNTTETLTQKFIKKGSWIFLFTILTAPLGYIVRIILTQDMSPSEFGILYGVISLLMLLGTYNDLGLTESLNYFLPKYIVKNDYARCKYLLMLAFGTQLVTSIILGFGLFYLADFIALYHFKDPIAADVIRVMSLFFLGLNMMQVTGIIFSASQNTKFQKGTDFFRMLMTVLGVAGLFFLNQGDLLSYAWAWIIAIYITVIFISILGYIYYYKPYFRGVDMNQDIALRKTFVKYSLGTFVGMNIGTLLHNLDYQILIYMTSSVDSGIYAIYISLIGIPFLFLSPILNFIFPVISEIHSRGQIQKIRTIHRIFSNTMMILMFWASALFIILGVSVATFLFGPAYSESGLALIFIAPFLVLNVLIQINFQIMAGTGMVRERIVILAKTLILNISMVILLLLGFKHSILPFPSASSSVSFAVGSSWIMMWLLSYQAIKKYTGTLEWGWILKNLIMVTTLVFIFVFFSVKEYIPTFNFTGRMLEVPKIGFVFLGSIVIFLLLNMGKMKEFITIIQTVRKEK